MSTKRGKKKALPKRRRPVGAAVPHINTRRTYDRAFQAFHEEDEPERALTLLQQIEAQGYMSTDVMKLYLDVLHALRDFDHYARIATAMAERSPEDPKANMLAASSACTTMQPISALLFYERMLKIAPEHPSASIAEGELVKLRDIAPRILDALSDGMPEDLSRIASLEKVLHALKLGRFDDVIQRAEKHLQTYPTDMRVRNNLAEALALRGDGRHALKILDETLDSSPENFFARAVRCRLAYFYGQTEKSKLDAEQLVRLQPRQISDLTKAAQSLAFIGDDAGIRWAYEEAEKRNWLADSGTEAALLIHYYATCLARAGDHRTAKSSWQRAIKYADIGTTAQENLEDLLRPPGEQWGPAYFDTNDWLSPSHYQEFQELLAQARRISGDDPIRMFDAFGQFISRFLAKHREVERVLPAMLDRGNAGSQKLAIIIARGSKNPEVKAALLNYVTSSRGTDEERRQLLITLREQGQAFESPLTIFSRGVMSQVEILGFEITSEPTIPEGRTEESGELLADAYEALNERDGVKAEKILRQVLQIENEQPDVLNNLAAALQLQNRMDEAEVLSDKVIEEYPEYFFGGISSANRLIVHEQYDEALKKLVELQRRKCLHFTEFFALAKSFIQLFARKGEPASAQYWLDMLEQYAPDHPDLPSLKRLLSLRAVRQ